MDRSRLRLAALLVAGAIPSGPISAQAAPGTDVYLVAVRLSAGRLILDTPRNLTARPGYDNQPAFTPDGRELLYSRIGADRQADFCRLRLADRDAACPRTDSLSEYSPTPLPDGGVSVVRVEADSTQRLWRHDPAGTWSLLFPEVRRVGYHAWLDSERVVVFQLGSPPTLAVVDRGTSTPRVVARNVGRSLQRTPDGGLSFPQRTPSGWTIHRLDLVTLESVPLTPAPGESQDHAWLPDGTLLMARGNRLYRWSPGAVGWELVQAFRDPGLARISRLAVSPDGSRLALVGEEPAP